MTKKRAAEKIATLSVYDPKQRTVYGGAPSSDGDTGDIQPERGNANERDTDPVSLMAGAMILPLVGVSEGEQHRHLIKGCPACVMPKAVQRDGWPVPCRILVSEYVECCATVNAESNGHHYECPYWDHVERTPF